MSAQIWEFLGLPPPVQAFPHLVDHSPPSPLPSPVRADTRLDGPIIEYNDFFTQTDSADCLHRFSCTLFLLFTYCLFQNELKHGALELCRLFRGVARI